MSSTGSCGNQCWFSTGLDTIACSIRSRSPGITTATGPSPHDVHTNRGSASDTNTATRQPIGQPTIHCPKCNRAGTVPDDSPDTILSHGAGTGADHHFFAWYCNGDTHPDRR